MLPFTIVTEFAKPVAILCDAAPDRSSLRTLYTLLPEAAVLCTPAWAQEQLARRPMLRPSGHRLAILSLLVAGMALAFSLQPSAFAQTQGSGAASLLSDPGSKFKVQSSMLEVQSLPTINNQLSKLLTNTWFFAATAIDANHLESDFSNEVSLSTTAPRPRVTLAWDQSPVTNHQSPITNYTIYTGPASRSYTNCNDAGTNPTLTLQLGPPPATNRLVTITSLNATNLQWTVSLKAPRTWTLLGSTNWLGTNPPAMRFWRGMSKSRTRPAQVVIKQTLF